MGNCFQEPKGKITWIAPKSMDTQIPYYCLQLVGPPCPWVSHTQIQRVDYIPSPCFFRSDSIGMLHSLGSLAWSKWFVDASYDDLKKKNLNLLFLYSKGRTPVNQIRDPSQTVYLFHVERNRNSFQLGSCLGWMLGFLYWDVEKLEIL